MFSEISSSLNRESKLSIFLPCCKMFSLVTNIKYFKNKISPNSNRIEKMTDYPIFCTFEKKIPKQVEPSCSFFLDNRGFHSYQDLDQIFFYKQQKRQKSNEKEKCLVLENQDGLELPHQENTARNFSALFIEENI